MNDLIDKRYIQTYGKEIVDDIVAEIKRNNWIRTGTLLNSVQDNYVYSNNGVTLEINIADHFQYLKTGKRARNKGTETKSISASTRAVTARASSQRAPIANIERQNNFVGDIIRKQLPVIDKDLTEKLNSDIEKMVNEKIKDKNFVI